MKKMLTFLILTMSLAAQLGVFKNKMANTYSIVAMDKETGQFGVAVQSNWFAVGQLVTWAEAGVGAIATQSFINVSFGPRGLAMLKAGKSAQETLDALIKADEGRDYRQLAIVDSKGRTAAYTGKKCIAAAGHLSQNGFSVQANLMKSETVPAAMKKAYENANGPFADRLLQALEAAQAEGGDIRGKQSAAILIVKAKPSENSWENIVLNLRVDDYPTPL